MKKPSSALPRPPRRLSREAKRWWNTLVSEWQLDSAALLILEGGLEAFDRMRAAQRLIEAEGLTVTDRFGQRKVHPAVLIERDCKATLLRKLKSLALDLEPLHSGPGCPPGGGKPRK